MLKSLFNKVDTPPQLFSCQYCEIYKNSFSILFYGTPIVAANDKKNFYKSIRMVNYLGWL